MNLLEIITELMPPEQDVELERYAAYRFNEFYEVLDSNPVKDRTSSICNSDAFWLYWLAKDLEPEVIMESGHIVDSPSGFYTMPPEITG